MEIVGRWKKQPIYFFTEYSSWRYRRRGMVKGGIYFVTEYSSQRYAQRGRWREESIFPRSTLHDVMGEGREGNNLRFLPLPSPFSHNVMKSTPWRNRLVAFFSDRQFHPHPHHFWKLFFDLRIDIKRINVKKQATLAFLESLV